MLLLAFVSLFVVTVVFLSDPVRAKAAGTGVVAISSARINGGNVSITVSAQDLPDSDDGVFYLYAEKVYQNRPEGAPIAAQPMGASVSFHVPLNVNSIDSRLYDKFQVAVLQGGALVPVSNAHYITNPEALAPVALSPKNNGKRA